VVRGNGGLTYGVYQRGSRAQFEQISALQRDGRIHSFGEADYRPDSTAWLWLTTEVRRIADRIVEERATALRRAVRPPARHVVDHPPAIHGGTDEPGAEGIQPAADTTAASEPSVAPPADRAEAIRDQVRRRLEADEPAGVADPEVAERPDPVQRG
jgi:hypothetical protein